ncbi:manganese efflux pump MntP [Desulfopila inferna]|uniref:manganese efflux pump MntP n=1 Tax=Desulfopila inferna TaxID=468528 RepID=UPI0019624528|nr:manganese efflux pump MntP family protein [Desulfopila inferna]MBM9606567.1 manganese efflux pump [Desulfopila inferna]
MHFVTILGIAVALAMDAFAVAVATGVSLRNVSFRQTFRLSWHFGLFQALMPLLGWYCGTSVQEYVKAYDHWIAFILLFLVGGNMLREAFGQEKEEQPGRKDATKGLTLVVLSVATSIDALAVGLSMSLLQISIVYPAIIIGIVAGLFTIAGLHLGKKAANLQKLSPVAEVLGGAVLWLIGLNILREHGVLNFLN